MLRSCWFAVSALAMPAIFAVPLQAQVLGVTSINTSDVTASSAQVRNGLTEFSGNNTYNVTYNGIERRLTSFVTGSQNWSPLRDGWCSTGASKYSQRC